MKIERILIQNFKNIRSTLILNFQKDVTLFVGPNGFGNIYKITVKKILLFELS